MGGRYCSENRVTGRGDARTLDAQRGRRRASFRAATALRARRPVCLLPRMSDPNARAWAARKLTEAIARARSLQTGAAEPTPEFEGWVRDVRRALGASLGEDHAFAREFDALAALHQSALGSLGRPRSVHLDEHRTPDQVLREAVPLLRDAVELLGGAPAGAPAAVGTVPAQPAVAPAESLGATTKADAPTALVSYAWTTDAHVAWVQNDLAGRLRAEGGVRVRLDDWDVHPGQSLTAFMEQAIRESDFVLAVCEPAYRAKTDDRSGGVGYEARLLTGAALRAAHDGKVIPVLRGDPAASIPTWLDGIKYVDLRGRPGDPLYEAAFQRLTHTLHRQYAAPPPVGPRPELPAANAYQPTGGAAERPSGESRGAEAGDAFAGREPVVLRFDDGDVAAFGAERIHAAEILELNLVALTPEGAASLQALRGRAGPSVYTSPPTLAVAYGTIPLLTATWARVRQVGHEITAGTTRWRLTLEPLDGASGVMDDVIMNGYSPDDIAGWRARRILLDERPADRRPGDPIPGKFAGGLRLDPTIEALLSGAVAGYGRHDERSLGAVEGSPLPRLFAAWTANREAFLAAARLTAALWLVLTRTVERVRLLDLTFAADDRLAVAFEGARRRVYTNREPAVVVVEGECALRR